MSDSPTSSGMAASSDPGSAYPPGSRFALLPGVRSRFVQTSRLTQHIYESGNPGATPIMLIHGNASSARFFEALMASPSMAGYHMVAPDLRGYGASQPAPADARRGLRDFSDDVRALAEALRWNSFHLLGWSLGGNIAMQYVTDHPASALSLTLHATGSPYGFGGTRGPDGQSNFDDAAGSGGGLISPEVVKRYLAKDFGTDSPFSPRNGLRQIIVKPTFTLAPEREDALVEQMLMMVIGNQFYPGDLVASPNWPLFAPGVFGSNNALSPRYPNQSALGDLRDGPPILWVRGADDQLVSDTSAGDPATLGMLGYIPDWPGQDVCPPQPMLAQIRAVLDRYAANGGSYREVVMADCAHSPLIEHAAEFQALFTAFLSQPAQPSGTAPLVPPPGTTTEPPRGDK